MYGQRGSAVHSFGELLGFLFVDWGEEWGSVVVTKKSRSLSRNSSTGGRQMKLSDIPLANLHSNPCFIDFPSAKK